MSERILKVAGSVPSAVPPEFLLSREWLVTNGLGGYASGTIAGVVSRRYHALLIAALPVIHGRRVMFNHLAENLRLPNGTTVHLGAEERSRGGLNIHGAPYLSEFRLELGLPVWCFDVHGFVLEKRVLLPHGQNTVHVQYRVIAGTGTARLKLRPSLHFRPHEAPVDELAGPYTVTAMDDRYEISSGDLPPLRLFLHGTRRAFTLDACQTDVFYRMEQARGYPSHGHLWSPGFFRVDISPESGATLVASTEKWEHMLALEPEEALQAERNRQHHLLTEAPAEVRSGYSQELVLAADQFLVTPAGRTEEMARARAAGDEVRTVIAGYHWFTDWGRDTMISLEGLTLTTGRKREAGYILRTFSHYLKDGLLPNLFPETGREGLYHTADATLWYFHAIHRYFRATGDGETLRMLLPKLHDVIDHHLRGTRFNIGVDPTDGLLRQGQAGYQLTWMDAKVGDWVVTPRRGKAVEINALWYNALKLLECWSRQAGDARADRLAEHAERARKAFNQRFWYAAGNYLYDVVDGDDGDDPSCRPNQVFAISLEHPILDKSRWPAVLQVVERELLTPVGLRSLSPKDPDYKSRYDGDRRARDAAYHQGTVWAWLIGPFIDAWMKLHPGNPAAARRFLDGFARHLDEACIGSISEVFDAVEPFTPRGCIAQAWSVAEVLRAWAKTAG